MKVQVGRWGNSLAIRLPKGLADRMGIREGDEIDTAILEAILGVEQQATRERQRQEALERIRQTRWKLPPNWKFDREEANAR